MRRAARHATARRPFDTAMKRLTASEPFRCLLHLLVAANVLLGGCATYRPQPLPHGGDLVPAVDRSASAAPSPDVAHARRLSLAEVAHLAVRNNPDLRAARKRLGVARARLYAARLPADPELSANLDLPTGTIPGTVTGWGIGLAYDLASWMGRGARIDSKQQGLQQADLELLWQAWQVSQRARSLTVRLVAERRQLDLLRKMHELAQRRPDLLALQAGYRSQEARVRAAILGQFASITLGITRARDTGSVSTNGFTIGLTLPLFSGNRGEIKIERATPISPCRFARRPSSSPGRWPTPRRRPSSSSRPWPSSVG